MRFSLRTLLVACSIIACMVGIFGRSFVAATPEHGFHREHELRKQEIRQASAQRAVADAEYLAKKKRLDEDLQAIREQVAALTSPAPFGGLPSNRFSRASNCFFFFMQPQRGGGQPA